MASSIPGAIEQFIVVATAALPSTFQVREGSIYGPNIGQQSVLIGDVTVTMDTWAELGPNYRHEEHFDIQCVLSSAAGNDDAPSRLNETYSLYNDISVAVANNPTLNNAVRVSYCRQLKYSPLPTSQGWSMGTLNFEVCCEQRVTSLS